MEKPKKKLKLPAIDSIQKLAKFWDTHDLTDFEDELDEVAEPVFARKSLIVVRLQSGEAEALEEMARIKGISQAELVREWVLQKIARGTANGRKKRTASTRRTQPPRK